MNELRINCPMRHLDNVNCTVVGGFCTAVNDTICEALHNAYDCGRRSIDPESLIQYHVNELSRTFHYRVVKDKLEKQGEWKHFYGNRGQCSVCGVVVSSTVRNNGSYCPNCGAYMKGAETDA